MTEVTVYGLIISNVLLKMIELAWFYVDNVYAVSLDHISPMHLSCLKASIDAHGFGIVGYNIQVCIPFINLQPPTVHAPLFTS